MDETMVCVRFWRLAHNLGIPRAQEIGQHEIVSNDKLEALDAAGHDLQVFLDCLVGKPPSEAVEAFISFQDRLQTSAIRDLSSEEFRARFLRGLK